MTGIWEWVLLTSIPYFRKVEHFWKKKIIFSIITIKRNYHFTNAHKAQEVKDRFSCIPFAHICQDHVFILTPHKLNSPVKYEQIMALLPRMKTTLTSETNKHIKHKLLCIKVEHLPRARVPSLWPHTVCPSWPVKHKHTPHMSRTSGTLTAPARSI